MKPAEIVLGGGILSDLAFVLRKPFTHQMYECAEGVAMVKANELIARFTAQQSDTAKLP